MKLTDCDCADSIAAVNYSNCSKLLIKTTNNLDGRDSPLEMNFDSVLHMHASTTTNGRSMIWKLNRIRLCVIDLLYTDGWAWSITLSCTICMQEPDKWGREESWRCRHSEKIGGKNICAAQTAFSSSLQMSMCVITGHLRQQDFFL